MLLRTHSGYNCFDTHREHSKMMKPVKDSLDFGIVVRDIKASLDFYKTIMSLEFAGINPASIGAMLWLRFGATDFKVI